MDSSASDRKGIGCLGVLGIVLATVIVTVVITVWAINSQLFGSRFEPVALNNAEKQVLSDKLSAVGLGEWAVNDTDDFEPEPYTESADNREIALSERELNALVARHPDAAERLAIDLADDLISAKLRVPLDPDFPFLGGKVLKASAGLSVSYANDTPRLVLRGVSVWGVPLPDAWLGNLKNRDLVTELGSQDGFWQQLSAGIEHIAVRDGQLELTLRE